MLKNSLKYTLFSLVAVGTVGCTPQKKITIHTPNQPTTQTHRPVVTPVKRPPIKEEILLGRHGNNTNLGSRVDVPKNNPTIGEPVDETVTTANEVENSNDDNLVSVQRHKRELIKRMPFPSEEYRHLRKRGRSTVSGKVYITNRLTADDITKSKVKLWLNPVTSYSTQWYNEVYLGGNKLTKIDKRLFNYLKFTYSSSGGNFNFFGVPSGEYYLTATIQCSVECGYRENKSVLLVQKVYVGSGTTEVDLSKSVPE